MATRPLLRMMMTRPAAVLNLAAALQIAAREGVDPSLLHGMLHPSAGDDDTRWSQLLAAGEVMGIIDTEPLSTPVEQDFDDRLFGQLVRRRLREEERALDTNSLIYIAYRASLGIQPGFDGGVPTPELMDRAEELADSILGPHTLRRYQRDRLRPWRWWITAAGLGFQLPLVGAHHRDVYVVCPIVALRDELEMADIGTEEMALADFVERFDNIPLMPKDELGRGQIPHATGAAFHVLEAEGVLELRYRTDAPREWSIPGRPSPVTHVVVHP